MSLIPSTYKFRLLELFLDPSVTVPQAESSTAASVANLARISANLARVSSSSSSNSSSTSTQPVQVAPGAANSTNPVKVIIRFFSCISHIAGLTLNTQNDL